jgi:hypothetical protein
VRRLGKQWHEYQRSEKAGLKEHRRHQRLAPYAAFPQALFGIAFH